MYLLDTKNMPDLRNELGMLPQDCFYYKAYLSKSQEKYQKKSIRSGEKSKMCELCLKTFCPSGCPNREYETTRECPTCGIPLYSDEGIEAPDGGIYCKDCISEMDIDEILQICEIKDAVSLVGILTDAASA